jgi:nitroreductase
MNLSSKHISGTFMCDEPYDAKNRYLDIILAERRSFRMFKPEPPSEEDIHRILHAGLLAPFAAAAVGSSKDYFRRFFVIRNGSAAMKAVIPLAMAQLTSMAEGLGHEMAKNPCLRAQAGPFADRLSMFRKRGFVPGIGTAPYYLVVAERKGFPPVELQSLAHCMENMWLKATALDLGFHLVSLTSQMSSNPEFCKILGIPAGEWELMGCAVGYPEDELSPSIRPPVEDLTRWLD